MVTHSTGGHIRITCPACRRGRLFSTAELFSPTRSFVTLRKLCPHCGSDAPLQVQAPPLDTGVQTSLARSVLRFDGPVLSQHKDN